MLYGSETPRLAAEPLRPLNRRTSLGFEAIEFCTELLGVDLMPWQKWWLIHALEVDGDGQFRYRTVLTLVSRQSGKTTLLKCLALYFMFMGRARLVLGAAQSLDISREAWQGAVDLAEGDPELAAEVENVRHTNGEQCLTLANGARYRIAAATRSAGRGLSVDLLILDELREHQSWAAWSALSKTVIARPNSLTVGISNAGDDASAVLNALRESALAGTDPALGIFEWSAPDGCDLDDRSAWRQANPGLGYTISEQAIESALYMDPPAVFRTELLCQRVDTLDSAVDLGAWRGLVDAQGNLERVRDRVVACIDVSLDGQHVTLAAAADIDGGRVRVEVVAAWDSTERARAELSAVLERVGPRLVAWYPSGPAGALGPVLRSLEGVEVIELKGSAVSEACQSFADLVASRRIVHPGDPLLDAHVAGSSKLWQGDAWRFARRGGTGHIDAAYAASGAVHVALTVPVERPLPRSAIF